MARSLLLLSLTAIPFLAQALADSKLKQPVGDQQLRLNTPTRVIDAHVHITNITLLSYSGWANASAGTCPCAPPCLCNWGVSDWEAVSSSYTPQKFVFIEVDADQVDWLSEASWVQSLSDSGDDGGKLGGIVAHSPPGFGTSGASDTEIGRMLDQLLTLPLMRGIRSYLNFSDTSSYAYAVNHTRLLGERLMSFDVCLGSAGAGDPTATSFLLNLTADAPATTFIIDHIGSPPALGTTAEMAVWESTIAALAQRPNVYVKIGGVLQYFKPCLNCPATVPSIDQVAPLVTRVISAFGYEKCLWEGNWFFVDWYDPMDLNTYNVWTIYTNQILQSMIQPAPTAADLDNLFYATAAEVYRVVS